MGDRSPEERLCRRSREIRQNFCSIKVRAVASILHEAPAGDCAGGSLLATAPLENRLCLPPKPLPRVPCPHRLTSAQHPDRCSARIHDPALRLQPPCHRTVSPAHLPSGQLRGRGVAAVMIEQDWFLTPVTLPGHVVYEWEGFRQQSHEDRTGQPAGPRTPAIGWSCCSGEMPVRPHKALWALSTSPTQMKRLL